MNLVQLKGRCITYARSEFYTTTTTKKTYLYNGGHTDKQGRPHV